LPDPDDRVKVIGILFTSPAECSSAVPFVVCGRIGVPVVWYLARVKTDG
jgi:hypothetical protein